MHEESAQMAERLRATVLRSADAQAGGWFGQRLADLAGAYDRNAFLAAFAGAGRRLRAFGVRAEAGDVSAAEALGLLSFRDWSLDRFARCAFLLAALQAAGEHAHASIVDEVFRTGDNPEREAVLAGLLALPEPGRFLATAVEACRSNVESVFAAIACENAYPSIYFADASFNQMVLKVVFIGLPLERVEIASYLSSKSKCGNN